MRHAALVVLLAATAPGCGPNAGNSGDDDGDGGVHADADPFRPDSSLPPEVAAVYAHSSTELYRVDPDTLAVNLVGAFQWPLGSDEMTDIAIDRVGNMVGISFTRVYAVDKDNAACTYLADLDQDFNGLSFVPVNSVDPLADERLVAAANSGQIYEINPSTGASTPLGSYGSGLGSSGDIVSVRGFGSLATVTGGSVNDDLARLDSTSFAATVVGNTGVADLWGLGFWENKVFGFAESGAFVLINPATGATTQVQTSNVHWWGAAVTTSAPVIP